ncbi:MAG: TetR/AcrR family transcriptional regulator [Acidobacteriota bacterium]
MPRTKAQYKEMREASRQKILDAALEVFANKGYHNSTVGAVAKQAGISQGLLYNYFKSKEEVLHELTFGMIETVMADVLPARKGEKITRRHIIHIIEAGIDLVLERPAYWKLYFSMFVQPDVLELVMGKLMELGEPYFESMTAYFKARGEKNPAATMRYFSAVMDGVQMHLMLDPEHFPAEEVKKMIIRQFT